MLFAHHDKKSRNLTSYYNRVFFFRSLDLWNRTRPALKSINESSGQLPQALATAAFTNRRSFASETKEEPAKSTNAADKPAASEAEQKLYAQVDTLNGEVKKLSEKNAELLDKYKRSLAETENLRSRLTKQIEDAKRFGIQGFCKDLLEVADILGHATQAVPKAELSNGNNVHLKNLYEGLTMTRDSMQQVFKRNGLEIINPINEKFNPNLHEALFQKQTTDVAPDHVVEVTKIGYKLHERCIRPALVGVSRN